MTNPVAPPAAPAVPIYPALGSPSFNAEAYAFGSGMPAVVVGIDALAQNAFTNATSAHEDADAAQASAAASEASAVASLAGSNFKGDWSALTGPLNRPATVAHAGRTWMLLANLADVTTATPADGSAYWRAYDVLLPLVHVTTATFSMTAGYHYSIEYAAGQVTGTMPPYSEGAMVYITIANGRYDTVLLRQAPGDSFMGRAPDDLTLTHQTTRCLRGVANSWRGL